MATFTDLAPTESDAAGVVGGPAFLNAAGVLYVVGVIAQGFIHID